MTDPFLDLAEENIRKLNAPEWEQNRRLWKILMLSPTVEVFDALCRGEPVPLSRLDPEWVRKFGLRDDRDDRDDTHTEAA